MRFALISNSTSFLRPGGLVLCATVVLLAALHASTSLAQSNEGVLISELPKIVASDDADPAVEASDLVEARDNISAEAEASADEVPEAFSVVDIESEVEATVDEANAAPPAPDAAPAEVDGVAIFEGTAYSVSKFELEFLIKPPNAPDISALRKIAITLGTMQMAGEPLGVFVPPEQSEVHVTFPLDEIPDDAPTRFSGGALANVNQQMVEELSRQGLGSIIVAPDEADIGFTTGEDLREEGDTSLRLTIFLPTIKEIQSFATGERIDEDEATNNIAHKRIVDESPVQANELFWPKHVDDYVARLNRHPGRRVVAQLSPSHDQQQLYLDYQITETKPWVVYASISNTGAKAVGEWQGRVGFVHLQPTNRDDILGFDYVMNTNGNVKAVSASYEFPLWIDTLRLGIDGGYADFSASTRESIGSSDNALSFLLGFKGEQARGGVKLAYNFFQYDEYFLDLLTGATFTYIKTETSATTDAEEASEPDVSSASDNFVTVHAGIGLQRKNQKLKLSARLWADFSALSHDTAADSDFNDLGRPNPDENPIVLRWDSKLAFFADALLADPTDPAPVHAHEVVMRYRGQNTFGQYRVIAHHQQVGGGMESVRGYEQGATAGDNVHLGTLEYRFHLPRVLNPSSKPPLVPLIGEFAVAPRGPGERPDWDLVLKAFYDVANVRQTDREPLEFNDTLHGVGVGTELFIKKNVQLRFDWGIGLSDARCMNGECEIEKNDWEINFAAGFFY